MSGKNVLLNMEREFENTWAPQVDRKLAEMGIDRSFYLSKAREQTIKLNPNLPTPHPDVAAETAAEARES